jgi:hypothetical protein
MNKMKFTVFLAITLMYSFVFRYADARVISKNTGGKQSIPLNGIWNFKLDPMNVSIPVKGSQFTPKLPETIVLPGSTDQAGKGYKTQDMTSIRLTRMFEYSGAAWYEKENIFIPEHWKNKELYIFLERAHWETKAWINGNPAGREESLSVPHVYNITPYVKWGEKNTIRFRVDNSLIYDIAYTHAISAETQTNWNGIIGTMEIQAFDKVFIRNVQVYPRRKDKKLKVSIAVANFSGQTVQGTVRLQCKTFNVPQKIELPFKDISFSGTDSLLHLSCEYDLGDQLFLWDEFDPNLYNLDCRLSATDNMYSDHASVRFGIRDFSVTGTQFTINDRLTFIRGAVNSCEFPLTGYPPTDRREWYGILKTCRDYGLNCVRFHSWCPPEEAFNVADELGLYLQIENPDWRFTVGEDDATNRFYFREAKKIFETYGNHPSFVFFCEGNELAGKDRFTFLEEMLEQWKQDPRHLYVAASGYPNVKGSDFYDFYGARPQRWQEGLNGRFNSQPLNTRYDYSDYVKQQTVPMITHEIGQWCAYPDLKQVSKYVGVLKPYNYEIFREGLREKNMLDQAEDFHIASGKFQVIQKKEEFESYLRTPGFGGYHLLQLNDFPGQGTSPVGVVDVFYAPKTYVNAEEFKRMQQPLMPLLRIDKFCWTNAETLEADIEFVNFSKSPVDNGIIAWSLQSGDEIYDKGSFSPVSIPVGPVTGIGLLRIPLRKAEQATCFELVVSLEGTPVYNSWKIWVYPEKLPEIKPENIRVINKLDNKVRGFLRKGGTVFLLADTALIDSDVPPGFSGISWNAVWSGTPPNLLGILCNPEHKAFVSFPTDFHSDWQWFDLVRNSKPMLLDHTPYSFKPLVQMIPDWNNNRKIGLILEARVENGKILMTSIALQQIGKNSPVARQMYYSLIKYISGEDFHPDQMLDYNDLESIFVKK